MLMQLLTDVDLDQEITILGPCIYIDDISGVAALQTLGSVGRFMF